MELSCQLPAPAALLLVEYPLTYWEVPCGTPGPGLDPSVKHAVA